MATEPALHLSHVAGNMKLAYIFQPDPNPIRASSGQGEAVCSLRVVVSPRVSGETVRLSRVEVRIPMGEDGAALSFQKLPPVRLVTPGAWTVETSDAETVTIGPPDGQSELLIQGGSLIFVLDRIKINAQPGTVSVRVREYTDDDEFTSGTKELQKVDAAFAIERFYVDSPVLGDRGRTVKLFWKSSRPELGYSFGLSGNGWSEKDCRERNLCYTDDEGKKGVETTAIFDTVTFRLDAYRSSVDGPIKEASAETTVQFAPVSFAPDHRLALTPSRRIAALQWHSFNAEKCSILVNGETYDDYAPVSTITRDTRYFLFLTGPRTERQRIQIKAHGAAGSIATLSVEEIGPPEDVVPLWKGTPEQVGGDFSFVEPLAGGTTAVVVGPEKSAGNRGIRIQVVDTNAGKPQGAGILIDGLRTFPRDAVALRGNSLFLGLYQELVEADLAQRKVVRKVKMEKLGVRLIYAVVPIPQTDRALVRGGNDLAIFDLKTMTERPGRITLPDDDVAVAPIAVTPDGKLALAASASRLLFISIAQDVLKIEQAIPQDGNIWAVTISPDGTTAVTCNAAGCGIVDIKKRKAAGSFRSAWNAQLLSNNWVLLSSNGPTLTARNLVTGRSSRAFRVDGRNRIVFWQDPQNAASFRVLTAGAVEHLSADESLWESVAHSI